MIYKVQSSHLALPENDWNLGMSFETFEKKKRSVLVSGEKTVLWKEVDFFVKHYQMEKSMTGDRIELIHET